MSETAILLEKVFAAIVLIGCLVLLVRLAVGPERVSRWLRWRSERRSAEREAKSAIERARRKSGVPPGQPPGDWDGNVYRPKNFGRPKKPH